MSKQNRTLLKEIIAFIIPIFLLLGFEAFFYYILFNILVLFIKLRSFIVGLLIIYCVFLSILSITKETKYPILILGVFLLLLSFISQIKIAYMQEPIYISDILFLKNSGSLTKLISGTIWGVIKEFAVFEILEIIYFTFLIVLGFKTNTEIKDKSSRTMIAIISIFLIVLLFVPMKFKTEYILNNVFDYNKRKSYKATTTNLEYYDKYGYICAMYGQMLESKINKPKGYNEDILNNALIEANNNLNVNKTLGKPNIIVIFSEAFWDIEKQNDIKFDKEVTSNFNKLKEKGIFFEMLSPAYGGLSSNVSFEFLTGRKYAVFWTILCAIYAVI